MDRTDEQIMAGVAAGTYDEFRTLYERYKRRIMTFAFYMLGERAAAEDIVQETFIRVMKQAGRFDPKRSFRAWVYTIAANLCRDEYRRRMRKGTRTLDGALDTLEAIKTPSPRAGAMKKEFLSAFMEELLQLPAEQREVVALHYLSGLRYREISDITGAPLGTVQSRLHAALTYLREKLHRFWQLNQ
jgi:RNA polymerase sigma-70 factor (ECF subfamily)